MIAATAARSVDGWYLAAIASGHQVTPQHSWLTFIAAHRQAKPPIIIPLNLSDVYLVDFRRAIAPKGGS